MPNFPINPLPIPRAPQVQVQPPPFVDPAGIIMQAAALRQQKQLAQQKMQQEMVQNMTQSLQTMAELQQRKQQAAAENLLGQQQVDIARGKLPLDEAQARLVNLQADAYANGANSPFYNAKQAAAVIAGPGASPQVLKDAENQVLQVYPNGVAPKDNVHQMAIAARFSQSQGVKTSEFDEKQWSKMNEDGNPMLKGSRYPIGQIAISNMALNQVRSVLSNTNTSDQELSMALGKLNTVMNGGSKDEQDAKSQLYGTLQSRYNKIIQNLTGTPQLAQQPQVAAQILSIADELQATNSRYADSYFSGIRNTYAPTIAKDPSRYMNMENSWKQALSPQVATPQSSQQIQQAPPPANPGGLGMLLQAAGISKPAQATNVARPGKVRVKDPNGMPGWIPQEQLQGALSNGYQQF